MAVQTLVMLDSPPTVSPLPPPPTPIAIVEQHSHHYSLKCSFQILCHYSCLHLTLNLRLFVHIHDFITNLDMMQLFDLWLNCGAKEKFNPRDMTKSFVSTTYPIIDR